MGCAESRRWRAKSGRTKNGPEAREAAKQKRFFFPHLANFQHVASVRPLLLLCVRRANEVEVVGWLLTAFLYANHVRPKRAEEMRIFGFAFTQIFKCQEIFIR